MNILKIFRKRTYTFNDTIIKKLLGDHPAADKILYLIKISHYDDETIAKFISDILSEPDRNWQDLAPRSKEFTAFEANRLARQPIDISVKEYKPLLAEIRDAAEEGRTSIRFERHHVELYGDYKIFYKYLELLGYKIIHNDHEYNHDCISVIWALPLC